MVLQFCGPIVHVGVCMFIYLFTSSGKILSGNVLLKIEEPTVNELLMSYFVALIEPDLRYYVIAGSIGAAPAHESADIAINEPQKRQT